MPKVPNQQCRSWWTVKDKFMYFYGAYVSTAARLYIGGEASHLYINEIQKVVDTYMHDPADEYTAALIAIDIEALIAKNLRAEVKFDKDMSDPSPGIHVNIVAI